MALAKLHQTVQQAGYSDVLLDFSECKAAFPARSSSKDFPALAETGFGEIRCVREC
jgi:hypothetical protein